MNFIFNLLMYLSIIGGYIGIVKLISFILKLFVQKFIFFVISIFITWPIEILLIWITRNSKIYGDIFFVIIFPWLFLLILYLCGKIRKISFSRFEYIFSFIVYLPSQFILIITYLTILLSFGYSL